MLLLYHLSLKRNVITMYFALFSVTVMAVSYHFLIAKHIAFALKTVSSRISTLTNTTVISGTRSYLNVGSSAKET